MPLPLIPAAVCLQHLCRLIQQVEELLGRAQCCCQAFAGLVQLTKKHPSRTGLLSSALKVGGQFVDVLLKGLAFWRALYAGGQEQAFRALIKEVQKGTKQLQVRAAGCINLLPCIVHSQQSWQLNGCCRTDANKIEKVVEEGMSVQRGSSWGFRLYGIRSLQRQ